MRGVVKVRKEVAGGVEIDRFVVVAVEKIAKVLNAAGQVVATAERDEFREAVGMPKRDVGRVIRAEAASERRDVGTGVDPTAEVENFVENISLVALVVVDPFSRMSPPAVEAVVVNAVEAE